MIGYQPSQTISKTLFIFISQSAWQKEKKDWMMDNAILSFSENAAFVKQSRVVIHKALVAGRIDQ